MDTVCRFDTIDNLYIRKYLRNIDVKLSSYNNILTQAEYEQIYRILIGCTKDIYRLEKKWYNGDFKFGKPSIQQLVRLSIYEYSRSHPGDVFRPNVIRSRFVKDVQNVDRAQVSRAFNTLTRVKYLKPLQGQKRGARGRPSMNSLSELPGPKVAYSESDDIAILSEFVSRPFPRSIIFRNLLQSNVIMQYLKFHNYSWMVLRKDTPVEEMIKVLKSKGPVDQKTIDEYRDEYIQQQNFLRSKNHKEIMTAAIKAAKLEVEERNWQIDPGYTDFFVRGGICYHTDDFES